MTMTREQFYDLSYEPSDEPKFNPRTDALPKPKYAPIKEQQERNKMALSFLDDESKQTYRVLPGESRSDYRKRIKALSIARDIKRNMEFMFPKPTEKPVAIFGAKKFGRFETKFYRGLVFARKSLRNAGQRDSGLYRWVSEQWFRQVNRMQGMKSTAEFRQVGTRSHMNEHKKAVTKL